MNVEQSQSIEKQHIQSKPGVCGGKPCVAGTRIRVQDIVVWTEQGQSADEIVTGYPHLTLGDVHAALAYYHDHREDVDRQMKESDELAVRMKAQYGPAPSQKTTGRDADGNPISS
jgi:uncharacterized protein (DUF433 family)